MRDYDFLVIGSGIGGLVYALQVSRLGKVAVVTKRGLFNCNTPQKRNTNGSLLETPTTSLQLSPKKQLIPTFLCGNSTRGVEILR